jgi:hypothetical protein
LRAPKRAKRRMGGMGGFAHHPPQNRLTLIFCGFPRTAATAADEPPQNRRKSLTGSRDDDLRPLITLATVWDVFNLAVGEERLHCQP